MALSKDGGIFDRAKHQDVRWFLKTAIPGKRPSQKANQTVYTSGNEAARAGKMP